MQLAIGADVPGGFGQRNGFGSGVGAAAGHDRYAARGMLDGNADDFDVFLDVDRGRLARGANHAQAVSALFDMPVHQFAQGGVIDLAIGLEGGDECNNAAGKGLHGGDSLEER